MCSLISSPRPYSGPTRPAVGIILEAVRPGTVWQDNVITGPGGYGIVVYTGCSSFDNLSLAMLCWVTISRLRHQNWRSRDLVTGGAVAAAMSVLNFARLCLMAWNIDLFRLWCFSSSFQTEANWPFAVISTQVREFSADMSPAF